MLSLSLSSVMNAQAPIRYCCCCCCCCCYYYLSFDSLIDCIHVRPLTYLLTFYLRRSPHDSDPTCATTLNCRRSSYTLPQMLE